MDFVPGVVEVLSRPDHCEDGLSPREVRQADLVTVQDYPRVDVPHVLEDGKGTDCVRER